MGSIGTFGSFTQARLAIYAAHKGLSVTGNNIANVNTTGYTRQRLEQSSFGASGADRYYSSFDSRVGNGVLCTGLTQLRDPYLDIRYRGEMANVGSMDAKLGGLENIQAVLDEVGKGDDAFGIIEAQLSDMVAKLRQLSDQTGHSLYDIQVRASADTLTKQLNAYASRLQEVYKNNMASYQQDVSKINGILTNIRDLNATIRKNEIHGDNSLELRDERNLLIDQLSQYMKVDVTYTTEDIGGGQWVEKLVIKLGDANPDGKAGGTDTTTLIDGVYGAQLSTTQLLTMNPNADLKQPNSQTNQWYLDANGKATEKEEDAAKYDDPNLGLTVSALTDRNGTVMKDKDGKESKAVDLADNDLYGALQSQRELLTRSGEFSTQEDIDRDPNAASQRGIPYYQKSLDLLARQFAQTLNDANQGYVYDEKGNYVKGTMDADGKITRDNPSSFTFVNPQNNAETHTLNRNDTWDKLPDWAKKQMGGANSVEDYLKGNKGISMGAPLFSNRGDRNDTDGITAANISISAKWAEGPQIVRSFQLPSAMDKIPSTESSNIDHMIYLFEKKQDYKPGTIQDDAKGKDVTMFTGSFQEMWSNIGSVLGNDMKVTSTLLDAYYASSVSLDTSRDSVSSVDFNDEAMNLMQYSKSYSAACRLMTTIDSVLDKLINGTGA
ncbi:flagellar basal body protein [Colidextribacter sp. 210702-DFI.3.9]|nr:flagellar basal body protein [Colidextribacter sp. 210702-DFI.3.9]